MSYNRAVSSPGSQWLEVLGRLHMMVVHLPIGMVLAAGVVEFVGRARSRPGARSAARWCLGLGALAAVVSATTGWIHAEFVPVSRAAGWTLLLHRCTGIATALVATLTWVVSRPAGQAKGESQAYRIGLVTACGLVILTGHWGGTLVHGPGYVFAPFWEGPREAPPAAAADGAHAPGGDRDKDPPEDGESGEPAATSAGVDFDRDVEPILAARCYDCHGARRQKGRLRLDRLGELFEREGQSVIVPGNPDASELIVRVELPADDLDVMPADGDPLPPEDIATLRAWILDGAKHSQPPAAEPSPGAGEEGS